MSRAQTITDEQLLEAARAEFLDHGIRATSGDIAKRAGVSQGILFHRFGTKEALFAAAMKPEKTMSALPMDFEPRVGKGTVQKNLIDFGEILLERFFTVLPGQLMAWANPDPKHAAEAAKHFRERGTRGQQVFIEYLCAEEGLKRIRLDDPFLLAQTFSGALWFFAFEQVTGAKLWGKKDAPSRKEFVRRLVDTLWKGLSP